MTPTERVRRWREANREHVNRYCRERQRRLRQDPEYRERQRQQVLQWQRANPKKVVESHQRWREKNPQAKIADRLRSRLRAAMIRGVKEETIRPLVSCGISEFRKRIEQQFQPPMSWSNYGVVWNLDHIRPCSSFDLTDEEQVKECFHYSNIRPLFRDANEQKHASQETVHP